MDWNGSNRHVSRPENSFGFLYNSYNYDNYPSDIEMKQYPMMGQAQEGVISAAIMEKNNYAYQLERKAKRLTSDQLDSLETSFQEEIKLDPDRKMKLAQELGLQPRQIAVWFQNRRARWKNKQLERLYDKLQQDFDAVSREKQKLQEEVLVLRKIVKEQATTMKGHTICYSNDISREETVESTSAVTPNEIPCRRTMPTNHDYVFNVNGCNPIMQPPPYWGVMPSPYP